MKKTLYFPFLICLLLTSNLTFSQQKKDTTGSSQFLFPKFTDGVVSLKDGSIANAKLNYDTYVDQMQFLGVDNVIMAIAEPEKVVKITISNHEFYYIRNNCVELISKGAVLLFVRVHHQRIAEKNGAYGGASPATSIQTLSTLYSGDGRVSKLSRDEEVSYTTTLNYYITNSGKTRVVLNQNDLLKCFSSEKELIKQELDKQNTKFNSTESVKKLVDWMNSNGIKD